jgi:N-sulfoglucosamine sulfohydrolase
MKNLRINKSVICIFFIFYGIHFASTQEKPNIVILSVDDMNYNSCGIMGCKIENITPNIDKLANSGILFTKGYVSIPVCVPCRTSILTGVYPHKASEWDGFGKPEIVEKIPQSAYNIKAGTPTLIKSLNKAGYITGILAKPNHHQPYSEFPWDIIYGHSQYEDLKHGRDSALFAQRTEEVIKYAKKENKPFFLSANICDPHRPFPGSETEKNMILKGNFGGSLPNPTYTYSPQEVNVFGFLPELKDVRKEIAEYYSGVRRADDCVGSVLKKLKDLGVEKNTIVFFFSDNGASFPFSKECCTMNGTRTPIVIKWPEKVLMGQVDSINLISILDFAPTVLDIINMPKFETMDGVSIIPLLDGKVNKLRNKIVSVYHFTPGYAPIPQRAITEGDYIYIFNAFASEDKFFSSGDPRGGYTYNAMKTAAENNIEIAKRVHFYNYRIAEEFYNNRLDPNSKTNLIAEANQQDILNQMRIEIAQWMKANDDPLLKYYQNYLSKTQ